MNTINSQTPADLMGMQMHNYTRRGGAYVLVLIVCSIAAAAVVSGLSIQRGAARRADRTSDLASARLLAQSGIESALQVIAETDTWRAGAGAAASWSTGFGPGAITIDITDETDNDLADSPSDPYRVTSAGTIGDTRAVLRVDTMPAPTTEFRERAIAAAPIAYWPLDDGSTLSMARLAGVQDGVYSTSNVPNKITAWDGRPAPWFDSIFTLGYVFHHDELLIDTGTIMCWVYLEAGHGGVRSIIAKDEDFVGPGDFRLYVDDVANDISVYMANESAEETLWLMSLDTDTWYHVAVTFGPDGLWGMVNGVKKRSSKQFTTGLGPEAGGAGNVHNFEFGARWGTFSIYDPMQGSVRDVIVFDRQMTTEEITALITDPPASDFQIDPDSWAWVVD